LHPWFLSSHNYCASGGRESRGHDLVTSLLGTLLGVAWTAVYFSLPVILYEDAGVFQSFGRSAELVKKTWGEAANASTLLLYIPVFAFLLPAFLTPIGPLPPHSIHCLVSNLIVLGRHRRSRSKSRHRQALHQHAGTSEVPAGMPGQAIANVYSSEGV